MLRTARGRPAPEAAQRNGDSTGRGGLATVCDLSGDGAAGIVPRGIVLCHLRGGALCPPAELSREHMYWSLLELQ